MSEENKQHVFLVAFHWQYGYETGGGTITRSFKDFDGLIGEKSIAWLRDEVLNANEKIFKDKNNSSLNLFISAISPLGYMTNEEFKNN